MTKRFPYVLTPKTLKNIKTRLRTKIRNCPQAAAHMPNPDYLCCPVCGRELQVGDTVLPNGKGNKIRHAKCDALTYYDSSDSPAEPLQEVRK